MPTVVGDGMLARSNDSVIPAGGVHVAALANACDVTIITPLTDGVMLGAVCCSELAVARPLDWSIGLIVLTPVNDWMPPTAPSWEIERSQT